MNCTPHSKYIHIQICKATRTTFSILHYLIDHIHVYSAKRVWLICHVILSPPKFNPIIYQVLPCTETFQDIVLPMLYIIFIKLPNYTV